MVYQGRFPDLEREQFGEVRLVPRLVDGNLQLFLSYCSLSFPSMCAVGTAESQLSNVGMGLSHASLQFFSDQQLYSRTVHSLRVRSSKQDIAFRSILQCLDKADSLGRFTFDGNLKLSNVRIIMSRVILNDLFINLCL